MENNQIDVIDDETAALTTEVNSMDNEEILRLREHNRTLLNEKKDAVKRVAELEKLISEMQANHKVIEDKYNKEFFEARLHKILEEIFAIPPDLMADELKKYFDFKLEDDHSIGWYDKNGERFLYSDVAKPDPKDFKSKKSLSEAELRYFNNGKPKAFTKKHFEEWLFDVDNRHLEHRFDSFRRVHFASGGGAPSSPRHIVSSNTADKNELSSNNQFGLK